MSCVSELIVVLEGLMLNEQYYLWVLSMVGFVVDFSLCMLMLFVVFVNDECFGVEVLMVGEVGCSYVVLGIFLFVIVMDIDCFVLLLSRDVWYQFVVMEMLQDLLVLVVEDVLQVGVFFFVIIGFEYYSGVCGNLMSLGCIGDMIFGNQFMENFSLGNMYFICLFMDDFFVVVNYNICLIDNMLLLNDEWD